MPVNHEVALDLVQRAIASAAAAQMNIAVSVVDTGGRVVACARMAGASYVHLDAASRKATASAAFGAPTAMLGEMMGGDPKLGPVLNDSQFLLLPGGAPVMADGALAGGIGIAGGHYSQDQQVLDAALQVSA